MLNTIFQIVVFYGSLTVFVGIAGAISTFLVGVAGALRLHFLGAILGWACGGVAVYASLKVVSYFFEDPIFHWYYFISLMFVIGPLNKAIQNRNSSQRMQLGGTNAMAGAALTGIIFLFIF